MPGVPKPLLQLACETHPGQIRPENEDSMAADAETGFAVLADGMGGHNAGEVASRMATEVVSARIRADASIGRLLGSCAEELITEYIEDANSAVLEAASTNAEYHGMGTTIVVAVWHESGVTYGHVGDSRLYRFRDGRLEQLTRDHSVVQEQVDLGVITAEQARFAMNRNVLTRAVGIDPYVGADIATQPFRANDVYLLCSDGLTDMLTDQTIAGTLRSCPDVRSAATRLLELANEAGGLDNISLILMQVVQERGRALS
jgi:protein phosphatase